MPPPTDRRSAPTVSTAPNRSRRCIDDGCDMKARILIAASVTAVIACSSPPEAASARTAAPAPQQQYGSLDQLLAPIALYPDQLLAQILLAAADADKVKQFNDWLQANRTTGSQLQDAAMKAGYDPSLVALAVFPQVVAKMAADLKWTNLIGQAFAADKSAVFASIQRLRHQAQDVGTLKDSPQQEVSSKTTSSGEDVIVIEPSNPQVVYVPQYNPTVVYTQAPTTTTVVVQESSSADAAVAAGLIGFTAGIAIGASMNNNYYYGPYGWHGGAYMYNDGWDDYYDAREDAREDWMDHREDLSENRRDIAEDRQENRNDRVQNTSEQRTERTQSRQENRPATAQRSTQATSGTTQRSGRTGTAEARGYGSNSSGQSTATRQRSAGGSDAFSGYSSGSSQRASSSRGQSSRSSSRGGGGRRR